MAMSIEKTKTIAKGRHDHRAFANLLLPLLLLFLVTLLADGADDQDLSTTSKTTTDQTFYDKVKTGEYKKIGGELGGIVEQYVAEPTMTALDALPGRDTYTTRGTDEILVEVVFRGGIVNDNSNEIAVGRFSSSNNNFKATACYKNVCNGYASIPKLSFLAESNNVIAIYPVIQPKVHTSGSVCSEGDRAMQTDTARIDLGLDATGMTIGVLSDSYDCLGGAAAGVASGDLPDNVQVLKEFDEIEGLDCSRAIDEGRAMMELIFDVAPGSTLLFHTAFGGAAAFASGIRALADAGCDVIVDDIGYSDTPYFMDGIIAQAADEVFARGIPFISAAGNDGRRISSWFTDAGFVDSGEEIDGSPAHNFGQGGASDIAQSINLFAPTEDNPNIYTIVFQWDDPWSRATNGVRGASSDLDFIISKDGEVVIEAVDNNIGGDPYERLNSFTVPSSGLHEINIILKDGPPPTYMTWQVFRGGPLTFVEHDNILSPSSYGHPNAAGAAGIAAADFQQTPEFGVDPAIHEDFSSRGGMPILFDTTGERLNDAVIRQQPRVTGPDKTSTTFFGTDNKFPGTSAAAPHVAGLVALMLKVNSILTPIEIYSILEETASDMDDQDIDGFQDGHDFRTGFGFVDGLAALEMARMSLPPPQPAPQPSPIPAPQPQPVQMQPIPAPIPQPIPVPIPQPIPAPVPINMPIPSPVPVLAPMPQQVPAPTPTAQPVQAPVPTQKPTCFLPKFNWFGF